MRAGSRRALLMQLIRACMSVNSRLYSVAGSIAVAELILRGWDSARRAGGPVMRWFVRSDALSLIRTYIRMY